MAFFNRDDYKQALTMGIGTILICSIMFQDDVDNAFRKGVSPAVAIVLWSAICPPFSGFATILYPFLAIGLILACAGYNIIIYASFAAVGGDFSPGPDKAVAMVCIATAYVAILHLFRVRIPPFDFPGTIAQLLGALIALLGYFSPTIPAPFNMGLLGAVFAIAAVTGSIVSMFIVPNPAGQRAKVMLGQLLDTTAQLQTEVISKLLILEITPPTTMIDEAVTKEEEAVSIPIPPDQSSPLNEKAKTGNIPQEGRYLGIAEELELLVVPIHKLDIQVWQIAVGIKGLLSFSALELDVYNKPHIFPIKEFRDIFNPVSLMEHLYITITAAVQNGKAPMRGLPLLKNELEEVRAAVEMGCSKMKEVILSDYKYETALMECAPRVEAAFIALKSKMDQNEKNSGGGDAGAEDLLAARELGSLVILAGRQLYRAWERLPMLIAAHQPEAGAVAEAFFAEKQHIIHGSTLIRSDTGTTGDTTGQTRNKVIVESVEQQTSDPSLHIAPTQPTLLNDGVVSREVIKPTPSCSSFRRKLYQITMSTGIHAWHMKLVINTSFIFALSATLNVIPAVQKALHDKAYWVIVTVMAIGDITTGGIMDNSIQRILGTFIGSIGVCATAGFGYLANGSTYVGSNAAKKVTQTVVMTLWMSILKLFGSKYGPRYQKFFAIATLMVPLIALLDSTGINVWANIGWRIANTCLGVAITIVASIVLVPVTASDHIREKTTSCLLEISEMLEQVTALQPAAAAAPASSSGNSGCFGVFKKKKNTSGASSFNTNTNGDGNNSSSEHKDDEEERQIRENNEASVAAKAIISTGIQKAAKCLLDIIKLRDVVAKIHFVGKLYYSCTSGNLCFKHKGGGGGGGGEERVDQQSKEEDEISTHSAYDTTVVGTEQDLEQQLKQQQAYRNYESTSRRRSRRPPPMEVVQLDQLISHLKHNIVYSNMLLLIREWFLSQKTEFTTNPQVVATVRAFCRQTAECFKALRMAILRMITPKEAIETVLNLRKLADDIGILYSSINTNLNSSSIRGNPGREAAIVHSMLVMVHNIELLYRAVDRTFVTIDDKTGKVISITDHELGPINDVSSLSKLLNVQAMEAAVKAVAAEEAAAAAEDGNKGGVKATRDGVNEISGMIHFARV